MTLAYIRVTYPLPARGLHAIVSRDSSGTLPRRFSDLIRLVNDASDAMFKRREVFFPRKQLRAARTRVYTEPLDEHEGMSKYRCMF